MGFGIIQFHTSAGGLGTHAPQIRKTTITRILQLSNYNFEIFLKAFI